MKLFILLLFIVSSFNSAAQWSSDPKVGAKVFTGVNNQEYSYTVLDGQGGVIVFWQSSDYQNDNSLMYNHLNSNGVADWATVTTGITLTSSSETYQFITKVISDGDGGAFISWDVYDYNDLARVYVQHISSTGVQVWKPGGISVSDNGYQGFICTDGSGGLIVAWSDDQYDLVNNFPRTFAQRISAAGSPLWASGGVRVLNTTFFDGCIGIIPDGAGGAILTMLDSRNNVYDPETDENSNLDIFMQRLNSFGVNQWTASGVAVCTSLRNQVSEAAGNLFNYMISDGAGGAIVAWEDYRNDPNNGNSSPYNSDIYAQKINSAGVAQWTSNGVVVCNTGNTEEGVFMMADGSSGAVITWQEQGDSYSIYSQKLNGSGAPQWTSNGKLIINSPEYMEYAGVADESGSNLLLTWGQAYDPPQDITAQKIRITDGAFLWGNGTIVCSKSDAQIQPSISGNGDGGAIISWTNESDDNNDRDIYANRVLANGTLPVNFIDFFANAQGPDVKLDWSTATESNSQYFGIQKSADGIHFSEIGKLNAAGNSNIERQYQYIDANAFGGSSVLYYRISETDRDGKTIYSVIRQVKNNEGPLQKFRLVANPVKTDARIEYFSSTNFSSSVQIIDQQGRTILSSSVNIFKGNNQFSITTQSLPAGIYTIILSGKDGISQLKMMKE